jgi:hypothetical protein
LAIKKEIEKESYLGKPLFDVWINETETEDATQSSWEACINQAETCDAFISILDGEAGWQVDSNGSGIGICHAEFETAYAKSPGKVRVVSLVRETRKFKAKSPPDMNFILAVKRANLLESREITSPDDLKTALKVVAREIVMQLAHEGARELKKSGKNSGQALDWSRLNFVERQREMIDTLHRSLTTKGEAGLAEDTSVVKVSGKKILFKSNAVPSAFSVSAAREMVGQPFLRDHELIDAVGAVHGGPVHIIACQKNVTETQAMNLLGFPDATIISGAFGIYVADNVQKIQLCLITNCYDAASTKHGLQKLFEWLDRTGENKLLSKRAISRSKILKTISGEMT